MCIVWPSRHLRWRDKLVQSTNWTMRSLSLLSWDKVTFQSLSYDSDSHHCSCPFCHHQSAMYNAIYLPAIIQYNKWIHHNYDSLVMIPMYQPWHHTRLDREWNPAPNHCSTVRRPNRHKILLSVEYSSRSSWWMTMVSTVLVQWVNTPIHLTVPIWTMMFHRSRTNHDYDNDYYWQ